MEENRLSKLGAPIYLISQRILYAAAQGWATGGPWRVKLQLPTSCLAAISLIAQAATAAGVSFSLLWLLLLAFTPKGAGQCGSTGSWGLVQAALWEWHKGLTGRRFCPQKAAVRGCPWRCTLQQGRGEGEIAPMHYSNGWVSWCCG